MQTPNNGGCRPDRATPPPRAQSRSCMGFARHEDLVKGWRLTGSVHRVGCNSWGVPGVGMGCVWAEDAPIRRLQPMM
jgi:hypothetical protein